MHWNPSSHRLSSFSLDYLLLPPRSVLMHHPEKNNLCLLHITINDYASHLPTLRNILKMFSFLKQFICLYTFSAINFQGYCICPVSCYTLLSRFQLPWPLSGCHNTTTLFVVSNNECNQNLAHLKLRSVHPASPILLTKIGPQRKNNIDMHKIKWSLCTFHTHLKFDNKLRKFLPQIF